MADDLKVRCFDYIKRLAESKGVQYSLTPTKKNSTALILLWDACMESAPLPRLKELSEDVLRLSEVAVVQGIPFPEPSMEEMEVLQKLFFYPSDSLMLQDTPYIPLKPRQVNLMETVISDKEEALKLQPNVQLSLFDLEGV